MAALDRLYEAVSQDLCEILKDLRPVTFRVVRTPEELEAASQLVYREYLKRGYENPNATRARLSIYHALPETRALIAVSRRQIIGTMTIIQDSPLGLPMDTIYKPELDTMRAQGHRLAEASMLSFDRDLFRSQGLAKFQPLQLALILRLFKLMFDYLRGCTPVTELVACFNPRHQGLYDFLHLKPMGGMKPYSVVNGNPAVASHLNIAQTELISKHHPVLRFFYGKRHSVPSTHFDNKLSPEQLLQMIFSSAGSEGTLAFYSKLLTEIFSPDLLPAPALN